MSRLLFCLFLLCAQSLWAEEIVCAPAMPRFLDPHQMINPLQLEISRKLFITLFPKDGKKGALESWTTKDGITWNLKIREGLRFQNSQGWRSSMPINALDVEFSLNRQLVRNAESDYEKTTFLPAKWAGLDDSIKSLKILKPYELELVATRPLQQRDLEALFAPPVGYVTSKDFVNWPSNDTKQFLFHPASGEYDYDFLSDALIRLIPVKEKQKLTQKEGLITYKAINSESIGIRFIKDEKCGKLLNATDIMLEKLKVANISYERVLLNKSKVVFHLTPELNLKKETLSTLRENLQPEKFKMLKDFPKLTSIFNTLKYYPEGKYSTEKKGHDRTQIYYCRSAVYSVLDYEKLAKEIGEQLKKIIGVEPDFTPVTCNQLYAALQHEEALGVLKPINYQDDSQLLQMMSCENKNGKDAFGFCVNEKVRFSPAYQKETDVEFLKFRYLFPLVDIENSYIQF